MTGPIIAGAIGQGDSTPHDLAWALAERPGPVQLRSAGGSFSAGLAMAEQVRNAGRDIQADFAASAAVMILVSGRRRTLARNGWLLIHPCWTMAAGGAARLRDHAEWAARHDAACVELLVSRTRATADQVTEWLAGETILSAPEALDLGFVDALGPPAELPERPDDDQVLAAFRAQFTAARDRATGRPSPERVAAAVEALVPYADQAQAFDACTRVARPPAWPVTAQTRTAAHALERFTLRALDRHRMMGAPLPPEPWTGRWICVNCGQECFHPPHRQNGTPALCPFCHPPQDRQQEQDHEAK